MTIKNRFVNLALLLAAGMASACGDPDTTAPAKGMDDGPVAFMTVDDAGNTLNIKGGFVRPVAEGAISTAGYTTLSATAGSALVGASAEGFGAVEIHETSNVDGMMRMRPVPRLELPAGEDVALAPGGYHLMMMMPSEAFDEGAKVPVTFIFEQGQTITIEMPVRRK